MPRIINIVIAGFDVFEWQNPAKFHSVFQALERDKGTLFCDALEIHLIELPKLRRQPEKDDWAPDECWALYIDNMEGDAMERIAEKEPLIKRAMTVEDIFAKNEEERRMYELREKGRRIYESVIRKAVRNGEAIGEARGEAIGMAKGEAIGEARGEAIGVAKGEAIGEAKGEAKGEARAKRQMARSLLLDGMAADKIAKITGLGIEEIKGLTSPENVEK